MKQLKRPTRRALLTLHVIVSVSWLGLALGLLALGIAAYTTEDPVITQAAYRAMQIVADWLIVPLALLAFVSGVLLSLGTPWGLARHHWVRIKFWLTLVTLSATVFALRPNIHQAAADGQPDLSLVAAPVVSSTAYLFMTAISVLKPWGLTRRGRRLRVLATSRKTVDERSPAPTA
ncbi:DUF2269 domain-containing protein [Streptomyces sp. NPDC088124]|uniref:DUF2269 domain-containing protein n=1 Tax=Streptomyces sp. NPDC088124 TaxID=3154654 RepID=UPI00342AAD1B